ncbi:MAG: DUF3131 domain-containing protein [Desulfovibrio sp.]
MSFKNSLIQMRSQIAVILGLLSTGVLVFYLTDFSRFETLAIAEAPRAFEIPVSKDVPVAPWGNFNNSDAEVAEIAWEYFENNLNPETGLVDSVSGFHFTTLWDTASYLLGLISAERLDIISEEEFHSRMEKALKSLNKLPLYNGELPNKSYNTQTLKMTDYQNRDSDKGIGWSAIDIGRLFVPLNILIFDYPQYTDIIREMLEKWDYTRLFSNGVLYGTTVTPAGEELNQEGRLGYEEYVCKSFALMGFDVSKAYSYLDYTGFVDVSGVEVPVDVRLPAKFGAHTYTLSEPYIIDGLEFGWDYYSRELAWRVYEAQEARYLETGLVTAVTETALDEDPYFVYNTVFGDSTPWACVTSEGMRSDTWRTFSTKAAFGWATLFKNTYGDLLKEKARSLQYAGGYKAGIYEVDGRVNNVQTCNTNGIILEAMHYRKFGPLMRVKGIR